MNYRAYDKEKGEYWEDTAEEKIFVDQKGGIVLLRLDILNPISDVSDRFDIEFGSGQKQDGVEYYENDILDKKDWRGKPYVIKFNKFHSGHATCMATGFEIPMRAEGGLHSVVGTIHDKGKE